METRDKGWLNLASKNVHDKFVTILDVNLKERFLKERFLKERFSKERPCP